MKNIAAFYDNCPIPTARALELEVPPEKKRWLVCPIDAITLESGREIRDHAHYRQYYNLLKVGIDSKDIYTHGFTRYDSAYIRVHLVHPRHEKALRVTAYASFLNDPETPCAWFEYVQGVVGETWDILPIPQKKRIARAWKWFEYCDLYELPTQKQFAGDDDSEINLMDLLYVIPEGFPNTRKEHALHWQIKEPRR